MRGIESKREICEELSPVSMCPCVQPEGHERVLYMLQSADEELQAAVTDEQIEAALHRCTHGRAWT